MEKDHLRDVSESYLIVAHDGSLTARRVSTLAIQIAQHQHLPIRGVSIIDAMLILDTYSRYQAELGNAVSSASRPELRERFQEYCESVLLWLESQCRAAGVAFTSTIEFGRVPEVVLREAEQSTLLALGRRGHSHGAARDALGQHFRTIAHQVQPPLSVGGDEVRPVQRVLLAHNESEQAQHAVAWAVMLQRMLSAKVVVVTVAETTEVNQRQVKETETRLAQSELVNYQYVTRSGHPSTESVEVATPHHSDLLVMGGYSPGALLEWLIGSTVDQVLRHTPFPVLIV